MRFSSRKPLTHLHTHTNPHTHTHKSTRTAAFSHESNFDKHAGKVNFELRVAKCILKTDLICVAMYIWCDWILSEFHFDARYTHIVYVRIVLSTQNVDVSINAFRSHWQRWEKEEAAKKHELACALAHAQQQQQQIQQINVMTLFQTNLIYHVCQRSMAGSMQQRAKKHTTNFPSLPFHTHKKYESGAKKDGFRGDLFLVWNEFLSTQPSMDLQFICIN